MRVKITKLNLLAALLINFLLPSLSLSAAPVHNLNEFKIKESRYFYLF